MDTLVGIAGKDFVGIACDQSYNFHHIRMSHDKDKILEVDDNKLLATVGEAGDCHQFGEFLRKNIHLYRYRNNLTLGTHATANFARQQMAYYLRRNPYMVNILIGGFDQDGPVLYWMDYLASMVDTKKAVQGVGATFVTSILDDKYNPNLTKEEAMSIFTSCALELKKRFLVGQYDFLVKFVDKEGIHTAKISV